jgi:broad specificity phosphatase PhoE
MTNLHHNVRLIDCSLSKEGVIQAEKIQLPSSYIRQNHKVDIIFVSPLTRALETAELLVKANRLEVKKVLVLPELTEVLSKICDLGSPIDQKRHKFKSFDFG